MPRYPIYVNLLDQSAQDTIAKPLAASLPAMDLLQKEGFRYQGYIDVFDAGPTLQANRADIRTVRKSRRAIVTQIKALEPSHGYMVANNTLSGLRMTLASVVPEGEGIAISAETAQALGVKTGDTVRYIEA